MSIPVPTEPEPETTASLSPADKTPATTPEIDSPDPITGEPGAHPVGVGVGALSAGAAGAAIGMIGGPIGMLVGATIGAIAGGLAGHEVASAPVDPETPVSLEKPLPTASSGLITPDESSFLADSSSADSGVTGEAPLVTESAIPAFFATSAEPEKTVAQMEAEPEETVTQTSVKPEETVTPTSPMYSTHLDTEQTIRTGAYYRYLDRESMGEPGSDFEDWIAAEKQVLRS